MERGCFLIPKFNDSRLCFPRTPLVALTLFAAAGCSASGTTAGRPDDANTASPEIKSILNSDESPKKKMNMLKGQLFPGKSKPAGVKSQAKRKSKTE